MNTITADSQNAIRHPHAKKSSGTNIADKLNNTKLASTLPAHAAA